MDVKLQNAYVETLLENFIAVVKQNIMLQAQLEVSNSNLVENADAKNKVVELSKQTNEMQELINSLVGDNSSLKNSVAQKDVIDERDRLQAAVNTYMKQSKALSDKNEALELSVSTLTKYVESLEQLIPVTKLKKIKNVSLVEDDEIIKNGGSF